MASLCRPSVHGNGYNNTAKYTVADMPLWPRPLVVFANSKTWTSLPEADRDLITKAAEQARRGALAELREREQAAIADLCKAGAGLVNLGGSGRARMQQAVAPLLAKLREDPATRDAMVEIESLADGGQPHSLRCPAHTGSQQAVLTGVFEATLRKTDKGSAVFSEWDDYNIDAVRNTLELSDGRAVITEYLPGGPINGFDQRYSIFKDVIKFEGTGGGPGFTARWKLDGNQLRFSEVSGPAGDRFVWGRTWTKTD